METIKHKLSTMPELAEIAKKWDPEKIRQKVRSIFRKQERKEDTP